ncbi:MAG: polysaccharide deacetylase family protein [Candidatus Brocadiae bacterium]|nr:polysaccharide deacetylase family protein [Candidatus Brocadiia bacterium]
MIKRLARHAAAALAVGTRLWPVVPPGRALVLRYHRVGGTPEEPVPLGVSPEEFDAQLRFLRARCHVVSPSELVTALGEGRPLAPGTAAITFDDGYADNFTTAFPLLQEHGLPAAFFVTTGWIGTHRMLWWDRLREVVHGAIGAPPPAAERLADVDVPCIEALTPASLATHHGAAALELALATAWRKLRLPPEDMDALIDRVARALGGPAPPSQGHRPMTWEQVEQLRRAGMEIGSHLASHVRLATAPPERARDELVQSKQRLEQRLGESVNLLAYPEGSLSHDVQVIATEAGYRAAFTTDVGSVAPGDPLLALRRVGVWGGGYRGTLSLFSPSVFGLQTARLTRRK